MSSYSDPEIYVNTRSKANKMLKRAKQNPISVIGTNIIYKGSNPLDLTPIALGIVIPTNKSHYKFIINLQKKKLFKHIKEFLCLPVVFAGHDLKWFFFCLWELNLPIPKIVWDTHIFEKANSLGKFNKRYFVSPRSELPDKARIYSRLKEISEFYFSLHRTCQRSGIPSQIDTDRDDSIKRIGKNFSPLELRHIASKAMQVTQLYSRQTTIAETKGILDHLIKIEMPYIEPNARMEYDGIRFNTKRCKNIYTAAHKEIPILENTLSDDYGLCKAYHRYSIILGIPPVQNVKELKPFKDRHPAIPLILDHSVSTQIINSGIFSGADWVGERIYPTYDQLGTDTGRIITRSPGVQNMPKKLRHVVVPRKEYLIGEADYNQYEVGIVAAIYDDETLIKLFNESDVYCSVAKKVFRKEISKKDRKLPDKNFKEKYPDLRKKAKTIVLGIFNGMTTHTISKIVGGSM